MSILVLEVENNENCAQKFCIFVYVDCLCYSKTTFIFIQLSLLKSPYMYKHKMSLLNSFLFGSLSILTCFSLKMDKGPRESDTSFVTVRHSLYQKLAKVVVNTESGSLALGGSTGVSTGVLLVFRLTSAFLLPKPLTCNYPKSFT